MGSLRIVIINGEKTIEPEPSPVFKILMAVIHLNSNAWSIACFPP